MKKILPVILALGLTLSAHAQNQKNNIVGTSIAPLSFLIEQIGKEKVNVFVMVPPGSNPHTYEPTPQQLEQLSQAKLFVKTGTPIEFELAWMNKLVSLNEKMTVCNASKGVPLIEMTDHEDHDSNESEHHHEGIDPHVWLSTDNAVIMARNIGQALEDIDPQNKDFYTANTEALIQKLENLKTEITQKLSGLKNPSFLVFHPSWGYFAKEFGLKQIAIEYNGKEPSAQQLEHIIRQARQYDIHTIFASPQFSRKTADILSKEIHGNVMLIDPLSIDYIQTLKQTADALAQHSHE